MIAKLITGEQPHGSDLPHAALARGDVVEGIRAKVCYGDGRLFRGQPMRQAGPSIRRASLERKAAETAGAVLQVAQRLIDRRCARCLGAT